MRFCALTACFLTAASLLAQTPEIQNRLELKRLEGVWLPQSVNLNGKGEARGADIKGESFIFKGATFQRRKNGKTIMEGRLEIDTTQTPFTVDMIVAKRKPAVKSLGVFELRGDTLTICFDIAGKGRPHEVKAGPNRSLVVYTRQKP